MIPVAYGLLDRDGGDAGRGRAGARPRRAQSLRLGAARAAGAVAAARLLGAGDPRARRPTPAERAFLLAHDRDPFNKWEAGRAYALALARPARRPTRRRRSTPTTSTPLAAVADDAGLDPAFKALALGLPSEDEIIAHIAGAGRRARPAGGPPRAPRARGGGRRGARRPARARSTPRTRCPAPTAPTRRRRAAGAARPGAGAPDRARPGGGARPGRSSPRPTT